MKIQNNSIESKIGDPKYFFNRDSLKSVDLARLELSVFCVYINQQYINVLWVMKSSWKVWASTENVDWFSYLTSGLD